jgi:hypothetical protein
MFAENRPLLSVVRGNYKCLSQLVGVAAHRKHSAQPPTMEQSFILTLYLLVFTASTAVIKGLLRNLLRSILSSSVDVLGLPEPWRLSIVSFCLHRRSIEISAWDIPLCARVTILILLKFDSDDIQK